MNDLADPTVRRIVSVVAGGRRGGRPVTAAQIISRLSNEGGEATITALLELAQSITAKPEALDDCVRRVRRLAQERRRNESLEQLKAAEAAGQEEEIQRSLVAYQQRLREVSAHGG